MIVAVLRRMSIRCADLVFDQLSNAFSAAITALSASSGVAEAAVQHISFDLGLMTSNAAEPYPSFPSTQRGMDKLDEVIVKRDYVKYSKSNSERIYSAVEHKKGVTCNMTTPHLTCISPYRWPEPTPPSSTATPQHTGYGVNSRQRDEMAFAESGIVDQKSTF
jgi:hypothetical protein